MINYISMIVCLLCMMTTVSCNSVSNKVDELIIPEDLPAIEMPENVGVAYDKFDQLIEYSYPKLSDDLIGKLKTQNFVVRYYATVKVDSKYILELFLIFDRFGETYEYDECHRVNLLLDGQPLYLPESEHMVQSGEKLILERVFVPLTKRHVEEIALAGTVEYRLCNDTGKFSKEDSDAWFYLWTQIADAE